MRHPGTIIQLSDDDVRFPQRLKRFLGDETPTCLQVIGNLQLLERKTLALNCSVRCPGSIILETYGFAERVRGGGVVIVSGFHSPMEKQCLEIFVRRRIPVVMCPARSLDTMRIPVAWRNALAEGRMLVLSPFVDTGRRATQGIARARNRFVGALADRLLVSYAAAGSKTEEFVCEVAGWRKPVLTFADRSNERLLELGAKPLDIQRENFLRRRRGNKNLALK